MGCLEYDTKYALSIRTDKICPHSTVVAHLGLGTMGHSVRY
jgi:hypothetical protein